MQQNPASFLLLRFLRRPSNRSINLLLIDREDGSPLQVWVHPEWKRLADAADQEFLSELMEDWKSADSIQMPALLSELERQSRGPLTVCKLGRATSVESQAMIDAILADMPTPDSFGGRGVE